MQIKLIITNDFPHLLYTNAYATLLGEKELLATSGVGPILNVETIHNNSNNKHYQPVIQLLTCIIATSFSEASTDHAIHFGRIFSVVGTLILEDKNS